MSSMTRQAALSFDQYDTAAKALRTTAISQGASYAAILRACKAQGATVTSLYCAGGPVSVATFADHSALEFSETLGFAPVAR